MRELYLLICSSGRHQTMKSKRLVDSRCPVNEDGVVDLENSKLSGEPMLGDVVWVQVRSLWWPAQVVDEKMISKENRPQKKRFKGEVLLRLYGTYNYLFKDPTKYHSEFEKVLHQNNGSYSETFKKSLEQDLSHLRSSISKKRGASENAVEEATADTPKDKSSKQQESGKNGKTEGSKQQESGENGKAKGSKQKESGKISTTEGSKQQESGKNGKAKGSKVQESENNVKAKGSKQQESGKSGKAKGSKQQESGKNGKTKGSKHQESGENGKTEGSKCAAPKQEGALKRQKLESPVPVKDSPQKSPEMSARRIKVMQSLGLVAPIGSPFRRNGIAASDV